MLSLNLLGLCIYNTCRQYLNTLYVKSKLFHCESSKNQRFYLNTLYVKSKLAINAIILNLLSLFKYIIC